MKPKNIFLIRHGQSEGNVDKKIYHTKPDYALELTELGRQQAFDAGVEIKVEIPTGTIQYYVSPYWRTRQTFQEVSKVLGYCDNFREDCRIREQEWAGRLRDPSTDYNAIEEERDSFGHFYYRINGAENCADVFDRVSDFLNTLHRDFTKDHYPDNVVIVSHGMTMRLFLMRWYHYSVEEFELLANPKNGEVWRMSLNENSGKYELVTEIRKYESRKHPWQFNWEKKSTTPRLKPSWFPCSKNYETQ